MTLEPLVALDWYQPQGADSFNGHLLGLHAGLNLWLVKHNATIKLDGGVIKASGDDMDDAATQIRFKYPGGTQIVSRDAGIQARGLLWDQRIDYRAAITSGAGGDTDTAPRFAARVAYNMFDAEPGAFLGGTYLGEKRILSLGAAFIGQPDGVASDVNQPDRFDRPFLATGGDVILDWPLDEDRVSGQMGLVWYGGASNPDRGLGLLFDLGYAIKWIEPLVALDWYRPQGADSFNGHLLGLHAGLNLWLVKHNATIKLDGGVIKASGDDMDDAATQITLQIQLFIY